MSPKVYLTGGLQVGGCSNYGMAENKGIAEVLSVGRSVATLMFQKTGGNGSQCLVKKMPDDALGESLRVGRGSFLVPVAGVGS